MTDQLEKNKKKEQLISTEELELQECQKQIKARELDYKIFEQKLPERKSCPPQAPQFQEFNFALDQRPLKEIKEEKPRQFKALPMPDLSQKAEIPQRASLEPTKPLEFHLSTNLRTERTSCPPIQQQSREFQAQRMPDFKRVSSYTLTLLYSCMRNSLRLPLRRKINLPLLLISS